MASLLPAFGSDPFSVAQTLVAISQTDLSYADRYLDRAATCLGGICSRERFHALESERATFEQLTTAIGHATDQGQWETLKTLAHRAASLRSGMVESEDLFRIGSEVYGSRIFRPAATALALAGVGDLPRDVVEQARGAVVERLRALSQRDGDWASFYLERAAWFERLLPAGVTHGGNGHTVDPAVTRKHIVEALERCAFGEIERLAEALSEDASIARGHHGSLAPAGADRATPFPAESVARAARLGLTMATLAPDGCVGAAAACRLMRHGRASSALPHTCPPAMRRALCDSLEFLFQRSVISSAASRYIPSFGPEALLVETFPETEPDTSTALLEALGLARRRGLARIEIEDALSRRTAAVCERLGLDPFAFTVACVPFDVYVRLGPCLGWGQQAMWTHLDGYEVTSGLELRAMVGGDVRYGGCHEFCMVDRRYDSCQLTARFVVARRTRFCTAQDEAARGTAA